MCECRQEIENEMSRRFADQYPAAREINASLEGYGFALGQDMQPMESPLIRVRIEAEHPMKRPAAGCRVRVHRETVRASFCPFCGEKITADEPATIQAEV